MGDIKSRLKSKLDVDLPFVCQEDAMASVGQTSTRAFRTALRCGAASNDGWEAEFCEYNTNRTVNMCCELTSVPLYLNAGVISRRIVRGKGETDFFPSNSLRERMKSTDPAQVVSSDDIVAFLEHVSKDAAACESIEESFRAFYPPKVMASKRTAKAATAAKFKTAIAAPMGAAAVATSQGRTWRPLNVLGTTLEGWNKMRHSSCTSVTSSDQDKMVLQLIMDYVQCGLLANKYGLAESWAEAEVDGRHEALLPPTTPGSSSSSSRSSSSRSSSKRSSSRFGGHSKLQH